MFCIRLHFIILGWSFLFIVMANFESIGKSLVEFDFDKAIKNYFSDKSVQKFIISTIQTRLFNEGLKQNNQKVSTDRGNPYTSFTEKIKQSNNQPFNRVTLLSNGDLYKSMVAKVSENQLALVANFDNAKYEGGIFKNFQNSFANKTEFRAEVMSLTDSEIDKIIQNLIKGIIQEMKNKI